VQNERQALGGRQGLQDDEQREADRVGQQRLVLGVHAGGVGDDRVGDVHMARLERLLAAGFTGSQNVEAHAGGDRRQPAGEVVDRLGVGAVQAQPGLLDGDVSLAERAEHPIGDRAEAGPVLLEPRAQQVAVFGGGGHARGQQVGVVGGGGHAPTAAGSGVASASVAPEAAPPPVAAPPLGCSPRVSVARSPMTAAATRKTAQAVSPRENPWRR
jgi:hypothetical protein